MERVREGMENIGNMMGEIGERLQRMKGVDDGDAGVPQRRMPTRVLRNPNVESGTNDQTIGSTDANKENIASFGESNQTFESMMNPSSDSSQ
ncbi:hypothetical protein Tco_0134614 [Tanacetum coccineum]